MLCKIRILFKRNCWKYLEKQVKGATLFCMCPARYQPALGVTWAKGVGTAIPAALPWGFCIQAMMCVLIPAEVAQTGSQNWMLGHPCVLSLSQGEGSWRQPHSSQSLLSSSVGISHTHSMWSCNMKVVLNHIFLWISWIFLFICIISHANVSTYDSSI